MKKIISIIVVLLLVVALSACQTTQSDVGSTEDSETVEAEDTEVDTEEVADDAEPVEEKKIKIAFVCKMLTHPWFQGEEAGMSDRAEELGIEFVAVDADLNDEQCIAAVDNLIAQQIDGLAIVVTNPGLGPAIAKKCRDAGIALVTIDDYILDDNEEPVPHIGAQVKLLAKLGAETLIEMARERGFFDEGNVVKVMQIDVPNTAVIHDRTVAYKDTILDIAPEIDESSIIVQGCETGMFEDNLPIASAMLQANPDATHWIVTGINDDCALAAMKIFQEAGFNIDNVLACGFEGADLAQAEFEKGNTSFIALGQKSYLQGEIATQILYDYIADGVPLPAMTSGEPVIVTVDNYEEYYAE